MIVTFKTTAENADTSPKFFAYDSKDKYALISDTSIFANVYHCQQYNEDGTLVSTDQKWVIKVAKSDTYIDIFQKEFDILNDLAQATQKRTNGQAYSPQPVYLVRQETSDGKLGIVMPTYDRTLMQLVKKRATSQLDKTLIEYGIQYVDLLLAFMDLGHTVLDRKLHDLRMDDTGKLVVIDWNVESGIDEVKKTAQKLHTARLWYSLATGRSAVGRTPDAFDDTHWQADYPQAPSDGTISVGLRVLIIALMGDTYTLSMWRDSLKQWYTEGTLPETLDLNNAEIRAIKADRLWRSGAGNEGQRADAMSAAQKARGDVFDKAYQAFMDGREPRLPGVKPNDSIEDQLAFYRIKAIGNPRFNRETRIDDRDKLIAILKELHHRFGSNDISLQKAIDISNDLVERYITAEFAPALQMYQQELQTSKLVDEFEKPGDFIRKRERAEEAFSSLDELTKLAPEIADLLNTHYGRGKLKDRRHDPTDAIRQAFEEGLKAYQTGIAGRKAFSTFASYIHAKKGYIEEYGLSESQWLADYQAVVSAIDKLDDNSMRLLLSDRPLNDLTSSELADGVRKAAVTDYLQRVSSDIQRDIDARQLQDAFDKLATVIVLTDYSLDTLPEECPGFRTGYRNLLNQDEITPEIADLYHNLRETWENSQKQELVNEFNSQLDKIDNEIRSGTLEALQAAKQHIRNLVEINGSIDNDLPQDMPDIQRQYSTLGYEDESRLRTTYNRLHKLQENLKEEALTDEFTTKIESLEAHLTKGTRASLFEAKRDIRELVEIVSPINDPLPPERPDIKAKYKSIAGEERLNTLYKAIGKLEEKIKKQKEAERKAETERKKQEAERKAAAEEARRKRNRQLGGVLVFVIVIFIGVAGVILSQNDQTNGDDMTTIPAALAGTQTDANIAVTGSSTVLNAGTVTPTATPITPSPTPPPPIEIAGVPAEDIIIPAGGVQDFTFVLQQEGEGVRNQSLTVTVERGGNPLSEQSTLSPDVGGNVAYQYTAPTNEEITGAFIEETIVLQILDGEGQPATEASFNVLSVPVSLTLTTQPESFVATNAPYTFDVTINVEGGAELAEFGGEIALQPSHDDCNATPPDDSDTARITCQFAEPGPKSLGVALLYNMETVAETEALTVNVRNPLAADALDTLQDAEWLRNGAGMVININTETTTDARAANQRTLTLPNHPVTLTYKVLLPPASPAGDYLNLNGVSWPMDEPHTFSNGDEITLQANRPGLIELTVTDAVAPDNQTTLTFPIGYDLVYFSEQTSTLDVLEQDRPVTYGFASGQRYNAYGANSFLHTLVPVDSAAEINVLFGFSLLEGDFERIEDQAKRNDSNQARWAQNSTNVLYAALYGRPPALFQIPNGPIVPAEAHQFQFEDSISLEAQVIRNIIWTTTNFSDDIDNTYSNGYLVGTAEQGELTLERPPLPQLPTGPTETPPDDIEPEEPEDAGS